jgi:hypothetical protein
MKHMWLVLALWLFSTQVFADQLIVHTVSIHSSSTDDTNTQYNNVNIGVGYLTDTGWGAGVYYNSSRRPTGYVVKQWEVLDTDMSVTVGLATGYKKTKGRSVIPMFAIGYKYQLSSNVAILIKVVPPINGDAVAHMMVGKRF